MRMSIATAAAIFMFALILGAFFPRFGSFTIATLKEWQELAGALIAISAAYLAARPVWLQFQRTSLRERLSDLRSHKKEINNIEIFTSKNSLSRIMKRSGNDKSQETIAEIQRRFKSELRHISSYYSKEDEIREEVECIIDDFRKNYRYAIDEARKKTKIIRLRTSNQKTLREVLNEEVATAVSERMKNVEGRAQKIDKLLDERIQNIIHRIRKAEGAE